MESNPGKDLLTGCLFRSNTYMSMIVSTSSVRRSAEYRRLCGQIFGEHIRAARIRDGRPLAELAPKGAKARRPGLDQLMYDARRGKFDIVLVWASDRIARSTRHFLEILDDLNRLGVKFASFREPIDTDGPLGRALVVIIGAIEGETGERSSQRSEPELANQFDDTSALVHGGDLRVVTRADVQIRIGKRWMVDEIGCIRG
jgi:hypothetical protein